MKGITMAMLVDVLAEFAEELKTKRSKAVLILKYNRLIREEIIAHAESKTLAEYLGVKKAEV